MAHDIRAAPREDRVTPELALVDPMLAEYARSRLGEPGDTLARVDAYVQASRMASLARRSLEATPQPSREIESTGGVSRVRRRWHAGLLAGAGVCCTVVVALLGGVRVGFHSSPAGAERAPVANAPSTTNAGTSPVETMAVSQSLPWRPKLTKAVRQRFAWAPVRGASAYHMELFRDSSKVFETDTRHPAVTVPARWKLRGRTTTLEPGDYRWYVWPVVSRRRSGTAIVQARLTVPSG